MRAEKPRGDRGVRQRTDRSHWFRMFARQSNILVISHGRVSRYWASHLRKTKSTYQRSVDRSVVDLEYLTGKQAIVLKPKQELAIYSLLQRRDVMEILSTGFGKSMILLGYGQRRNMLIENLYDHNFPSKKYYGRPDIGNVVAELYSNGPYDKNSKFASRKSTSIFSITWC